MSRIGKLPVELPAGVTVSLEADNVLKVKGPKGELSQTFSSDMKINVEEAVITVERFTERKQHKALHGLTRVLISNMVTGVVEGFSKELEIVGVGYRAQLQGNKLVLNVGFSHSVDVEPLDGVTFELPQPTQIIVRGIDKQKVGQAAADIRRVRPPEPYKGRGIRYKDEYVRRKEGKTGM